MRNLGPQFDQLAMFHPVKDFIRSGKTNDATFYPNDVGASEPREGRGAYEELWHFDAAENKKYGPPNLSRPVEVYHTDDTERNPFDTSDRGYNQPFLSDGHHRVVAQRDTPERLIPVEHLDDRNIGTGVSDPNPKMFQGAVLKKPR